MNGHSSSLEAQTMQQPYEPSSELRLSTQGSVTETVTAGCSLLDHLEGPAFRQNTNLVVDFLMFQAAANSASLQPPTAI